MKQADPEILDQPISAELMERRYVYNGEPNTTVGDDSIRWNRPVKRRKRSPFKMVSVLFLISALIVFYVWNKIEVNRLAVELNDLQGQYQKILYANESLKAEVNKKSSLERIGRLAADQLRMTYPNEQPVWFTLDERSVARLDY